MQERLKKIINIVIIATFLWSHVIGIVGAQLISDVSNDYKGYLETLEYHEAEAQAWEQHALQMEASYVRAWEKVYDRADIEKALTQTRIDVQRNNRLAEIKKQADERRLVYGYIQGANRAYLYKRKEGDVEEYEYDSDGNIQYKGLDGLAEDDGKWDAAVDAGKTALEKEYKARMAEEGKKIDITITEAEYETYLESYRTELERIIRIGKQRFKMKRRLDTYSARKQAEEESAKEEVNKILDTVSKELGTGIKEGGDESAETDVGTGVITGEGWHETFIEEYNRGIELWNNAEKELLQAWSTWEQASNQTIIDGQKAWSEGYVTLIAKREIWEKDIQQEYVDGLEQLQTEKEKLDKSIAAEALTIQSETVELYNGYAQALQYLIGAEQQDEAGNVVSSQGYYRMLQDRLSTADEMIAYWKAEPDTPPKRIMKKVDKKYCQFAYDPSYKVGVPEKGCKALGYSLWNEITVQEEVLDRLEAVYGTKEEEFDRWNNLKKGYENQITSVKKDIEAMYKELLGLDGNSEVNVENLLREDAEGLSEVSRYLDSFQYALKEAKEEKERREKEHEIAEAVYEYATDATSNRATKDELANLLKIRETEHTTAKAEYDGLREDLIGSQTDLDTKKKVLDEKKQEISKKKEEVIKLTNELEAARTTKALDAQDTINLANGGYDRIQALLKQETRIKNDAYKAYETWKQARNQELLEAYIDTQEPSFQQSIRAFLKEASLSAWLTENLQSDNFTIETADLETYVEIENYFAENNEEKIQSFRKARVQTAIDKIDGIRISINDYKDTLTPEKDREEKTDEKESDQEKIDELSGVSIALSAHITFLTKLKGALDDDVQKRTLLQSGTNTEVALLQAILEGQETIAELNIDMALKTKLEDLTKVDDSILLDTSRIEELDDMLNKSKAHNEWEASKKLFDLFGRFHKEYVIYERTTLLADWTNIEQSYPELDAISDLTGSISFSPLTTKENISKYKKAIDELVANTRLTEGELIAEYANTKITRAVLLLEEAEQFEKDSSTDDELNTLITEYNNFESIYENIVGYAQRGDALGSAIYELNYAYAKIDKEQIKAGDAKSEWDKTEVYAKRIAQLLYEEILKRRAKYVPPSTTGQDDDNVDSNTGTSTDTKDDTPSTDTKDDTPSTDTKDDTPSTDTKDDTPSTDTKDDTPSTDTKDDTPSTDTKDDTPSTPSTDTKDDTPSTDTKDDTPSTPSTDTTDDTPSTDTKDDTPSTDTKDDTPSTDTTDDTISTPSTDTTSIDPNNLILIYATLLDEYGATELHNLFPTIWIELWKLEAISKYIANEESGAPEDTILLSKYQANAQNQPDDTKTYTEEEREENRVYYEQEGTLAVISYEEALYAKSQEILVVQIEMNMLIQSYLDNMEYQAKKSNDTLDPDSEEPTLPTLDEIRKVQARLIALENELQTAKTNVESKIEEEKKYALEESTSIVSQMLDNLKESAEEIAVALTEVKNELELLDKKIDTSLSEEDKGEEEVRIVAISLTTLPTITNENDLASTDTAVAHAQAIQAWRQLTTIQKTQYQVYYEQQGASAFVEYHTQFAAQNAELQDVYTEAQQKIEAYLDSIKSSADEPQDTTLTEESQATMLGDIKLLLEELNAIEQAESTKRREVESIIRKEHLYILPIGKSAIASMMEEIGVSEFSTVIEEIRHELETLQTSLANDKNEEQSETPSETPTMLASYPNNMLPTLKDIFNTTTSDKKLIATIWHILTEQQQANLYDSYKEVINYQQLLDGTISGWYHTETEGGNSLEEGALLYAFMQKEEKGTSLSFDQWQTIQAKQARIKEAFIPDQLLSEKIVTDYRVQRERLSDKFRNTGIYTIQNRELTIESNNQAYIASMNGGNSDNTNSEEITLTTHWKAYEQYWNDEGELIYRDKEGNELTKKADGTYFYMNENKEEVGVVAEHTIALEIKAPKGYIELRTEELAEEQKQKVEYIETYEEEISKKITVDTNKNVGEYEEENTTNKGTYNTYQAQIRSVKNTQTEYNNSVYVKHNGEQVDQLIKTLTDELKSKDETIATLNEEYEQEWVEYEKGIASYRNKYKAMMTSHKDYKAKAFEHKKQEAIEKYAKEIYQEVTGSEIDALGRVETARKALRIAEGKYKTLKEVEKTREDILMEEGSEYTKDKAKYFRQYRDEYQMQEILLYMAEEVQKLQDEKAKIEGEMKGKLRTLLMIPDTLRTSTEEIRTALETVLHPQDKIAKIVNNQRFYVTSTNDPESNGRFAGYDKKDEGDFIVNDRTLQEELEAAQERLPKAKEELQKAEANLASAKNTLAEWKTISRHEGESDDDYEKRKAEDASSRNRYYMSTLSLESSIINLTSEIARLPERIEALPALIEAQEKESEEELQKITDYLQGADGTGQYSQYTHDMESMITWLMSEDINIEAELADWSRALWYERVQKSGLQGAINTEYKSQDSLIFGIDDKDIIDFGKIGRSTENEINASYNHIYGGDPERQKWYEFYKFNLRITRGGKMYEALDWHQEYSYFKKVHQVFLNDERRYSDEERHHLDVADEMNKTIIGALGSWVAYIAAGVAREKKDTASMHKDRIAGRINSSTREAQGKTNNKVGSKYREIASDLAALQKVRAQLEVFGFYESADPPKYRKTKEAMVNEITNYMKEKETAEVFVKNKSGSIRQIQEGEAQEDEEEVLAMITLYTDYSGGTHMEEAKEKNTESVLVGKNMLDLLEKEMKHVQSERKAHYTTWKKDVEDRYYTKSTSLVLIANADTVFTKAFESYEKAIEEASAEKTADGVETKSALTAIEEAYTTAITELQTAAIQAYGKNYEQRSDAIHMINDYMALNATVEGSRIEGQVLSELESQLNGMYLARLRAQNGVRQRAWAEAEEKLNEEYTHYTETYASLAQRSRDAWANAETKYLDAYRQWNNKVNTKLEDANEEWQIDYEILKTKKATWAEELAKEAIKGGIYKSKSGKEHSVANAIASVSITRDSLKLEEVQTPESFLGNIALLRTKMNKLYKGLGLKTYLLQSPNLGLQKYTATRQVLGKMRKENAEEEKQYKAGIMERLVKEKQKQAKEIKIRFIEQIEDANEQSEYGIIQILDDSGYNVEGSSYEKKILVDSSLMKKEVYEEVSIRKYKKYVLDNKLEKELDVDITLRKGVNASYYEAKLRTLEMKLAKVGKKVFGSDAGEGSIEEQLETLEAKGIQAKQEDGQILKGMLALHVGSGAQLSTDAQSVGNKGSGEKGRILTAYYEGVIKENKGWAEFKKPVHRKKVLNTHGMSENDPIAAGLKQTMSFSIADAAITTAVIAGTVLGGLAGGQVWIGAAIGFALNTAVNASITAADVGTGYRDGDEAWQEFAVNTAIEGVTTAVTLGLAQGAGALAGSASKGIMGGAKVAGKSVPAARSILAGATSGAIKGAGSMVGAMSSRYIGAGIRSMSKGKSFGDGMGDQMQLDWDTGAYANDLIGVAASMAGGAVSGGFQAFVPTSLGTNAISNFAGALTNSAVDYGARRVQSGIEDGWDNWEGSGMKFNVLNTNDLGMGGSTGLLELELGGKYGVQGRVGTGGLGVSGSALAAMRADAQNYRKAAAYRNSDRDDVSNNWAAMLAMYSSGDEAAQGLVDELEQGSAEFAIGTGDAVGQTILGDDGIKRIYVSSDMASAEGGGIQFGDTLASQLQGATLGVHEAYRDGVVGSNEEQAIETAQATIGHTVFASRVAQRFGDSVYGGNGFGATVMNDLNILKTGGIEALAGHAVNNYDSSADYWKLLANGTLENDGQGWLKNEAGEFIRDEQGNKIGADDIEEGLKNILNPFVNEESTYSGFAQRHERDRLFRTTQRYMKGKITMKDVMRGYAATIASAVFDTYYGHEENGLNNVNSSRAEQQERENVGNRWKYDLQRRGMTLRESENNAQFNDRLMKYNDLLTKGITWETLQDTAFTRMKKDFFHQTLSADGKQLSYNRKYIDKTTGAEIIFENIGGNQWEFLNNISLGSTFNLFSGLHPGHVSDIRRWVNLGSSSNDFTSQEKRYNKCKKAFKIAVLIKPACGDE